MTTMQQKLKWFGAQLAAAYSRTYHYCKPNSVQAPYAVWAEDSEASGGSFHADNRKAEQIISGSLNYFTKTEYDSVVDDLQDCLDVNRASWYLSSVQYEPETGLIHFEWRWNIGKVQDSGAV